MDNLKLFFAGLLVGIVMTAATLALFVISLTEPLQ